MRSSQSMFYLLLCVSLTFIEGSELDYDGWLQLRLYHAVNDDPVASFTERGNITVSSVRSGASVAAQMELQEAEIERLKKSAENGGIYRLKAVARTSSGSETTFLSSVPACHVLGSELEDTIAIWLDSAVEPVAVNLISPGPCNAVIPLTKLWSTHVQVKYSDAGPVPDTATYIQKLEREREARERGEAKDNRSFLAKYWMYIVPALIFIVLSSATNPEAAAAGGGGGGGSFGGAQRQ